jgi:hypothetical protein
MDMRAQWDDSFGNANRPAIFMNDFTRLNRMQSEFVSALNRLNQLQCLRGEHYGLARR